MEIQRGCYHKKSITLINLAPDAILDAHEINFYKI